MALKRLVLELGMGTALRSGSYTKAACRAVQNALWHNSLALVELFDAGKDSMVITAEIACQNPDQVDCETVAGEFPYGQVSVIAVPGGLDIAPPDKPEASPTIMAHAAISVSLDIERKSHGGAS